MFFIKFHIPVAFVFVINATKLNYIMASYWTQQMFQINIDLCN